MTILALSGWAQPYDALKYLIPQAVHLPYEEAASLPEAIARLRPYAHVPLAIGWSLGGLILMQASAQGVIAPKALVILCSPLQFVADPSFPHGMGPETFALFRGNFLAHPEKTARRFHHLIAEGDDHYVHVIEKLRSDPPVVYDPWQQWLDILGASRHEGLPLAGLPPTLLIYGEKDRIVASAQGEYLHKRIGNSELHVLKGCAHAPHLHDAGKLLGLIQAFTETRQ